MVDSFRSDITDFSRAAAAANVSYNTARKAFTKGLGENKPPIGQLLSKEMVRVRAQLQELRESVVDEDKRAVAARKDVAASREADARAVRMARNNAIAAMGVSSNLIRAGVDLSNKVKVLMSDPSYKPKPGSAVNLMRMIVSMNREAVETAKLAQDMERQILGQPDVIIGITDMTVEQALVTVAQGERTMRRLRRRAIAGDLPETIPVGLIDVTPSRED